MVLNTKKSEIPIKLHCNSGSQKVEYNDNINGYGRVWYNPKEISNILSLYFYTRKHRVVFGRKYGN